MDDYDTLNDFVNSGIRYEWFNKYLILEPNTLNEGLQQFEREFATSFPEPLAFILEHWTVGNSNLLLETLPALLNPTVPPKALTPTGRRTNELFPEFYQRMERAEKLAVIAYMANRAESTIEYMVIGLAFMPESKEYGIIWSYFVPHSLEWIATWEVARNILLTPQLKQMYICCNGNMNDYPYFIPLEGLFYGRLAGWYVSIWNEVESPEPFERLEQFVIVSENGCGDEYGFFSPMVNSNGEYPFLMWNHETAKFEPYADDFVALWNKINEWS